MSKPIDEDSPPNVPPPPGPSTMLPPEPLETPRVPREALPDRTDDILEKLAAIEVAAERREAAAAERDRALIELIEQNRRDSVGRDRALIDHMSQLKSEVRDDLNTKLDGQAERFANELQALGRFLKGTMSGVEDVRKKVIELAVELAETRTETIAALKGLATQVSGVAECAKTALEVAEDTKQGVANTFNAVKNQPHDEARNAGRKPGAE